MLKRNKKKGFTLIEVICSLMIFSIFFVFGSTLEMINLKLQKEEKIIEEHTEFLEFAKSNMESNCSKTDIQTLVDNGKIYLSQEDIKVDEDTIPCFKSSITNKKAYVEIKETLEGKLIKVNLIFNFMEMGRLKVVDYEFYKGDFI